MTLPQIINALTSLADAESRGEDVHYEMHTLVPAENAIGDKAYWHPLDDSDGIGFVRWTDRAEAEKAFAENAAKHDWPVRLVEVTARTIQAYPRSKSQERRHAAMREGVK